MKSCVLPPAPATSIVIRAGVKDANNDNVVLQQANCIGRAAYFWDHCVAVERVISVPESQLDRLQWHLSKRISLYGFRCVARPDGLLFGPAQEFNERLLIENPGQIALCDADFGQLAPEPPRASYTLNPEQFAAEFADASRLAVRNSVMMWSFEYRQSQGPYVGRQFMHASVSTSADGFVISGSSTNRRRGPFEGHFLRNLIMFNKAAKGTWSNLPLLEDLYRCISELTYNPESLGRYHGTRVRFPDDRTNDKSLKSKLPYRRQPDWLEGRQRIVEDFGSKWLLEFPDVFQTRRKEALNETAG